jgi:predicted N-acetyltransferase YhbS
MTARAATNEWFRIIHAPAPAREAEALLDAAFGLDRRTKASYRLREGSAPVPGLSFHAIDTASGRLAGLVSFWPLRVHPVGTPALLLGPLAVHPAFQNGGLGAALMRAGLTAAREAGHVLVFLVGDEPYYGRYGFAPTPRRITLPGPYDPARLLHLELAPGALGDAAGLLLPQWRHERLRARK